MPAKQTSKAYFTSLTIIHAAMLTGQVLFGLLVYYLNSAGQISSDKGDLNEIFQIIVPTFIIGGILGSSFVTRARLKTIKEKTELKEKLGDYRGVLIIKFALLEGPSFFALVCYLLTANYLFLGLAGLIMIIFLFNRPTRDKTSNDLELDQTDIALIEDPLALVAEVKQRDEL